MAKLKVSERVRRINIVQNLIGVKYKNPTKIVGKRFRSLNRIYLSNRKFENSNFVFSPILGETKSDLSQMKALIGKQFPGYAHGKKGAVRISVPKRVQGTYVPLRVAGPEPKIEFDLTEKTFSISGMGVPPTDFIPVSRAVAVEEFNSDGETGTAFSKILDRYPKGTQFVPVDIDGSNFKKGTTGDKGFMRKQIQEWITTYGWAMNWKTDYSDTKDDKFKKQHDMGRWFVGLSIIHEGNL